LDEPDREYTRRSHGTRTRRQQKPLKKSSGTDTTDISTSLNNTAGTVDVTSGTLNLTGGLDNFSTSTGGVGTLAGGAYVIRSNSVLKFTGADIDANAATIVLDGLGSAIVDQNNSDAIDNLSDNEGTFTIRSDRDLRTAGALRNDGSVTIGTGSVLTTTGEYVQAAGSTVLEDTTSKLVASGARVRVQDGAMKGVGTVEPAPEATGGSVQPGISSGILKVAGTYAQGSSGKLEVEIGGAGPGSGHDQLDVATSASLGGTLDIVTPNGFTPTAGESFTILKCGADACRSGQFDTVQGTDIGSGLKYQVRYNATDVTLELNNPPVANNHSYSVDEDGTLTKDAATGVRSNDTDLDGDSLTVTSNTSPAHGSVTVNANGSFTYEPDDNYHGSDSFDYIVSDGKGGTDTGTVNLTVNAVNDAPEAAFQPPVTTNEDTNRVITLSATDVARDNLTFAIVSGSGPNDQDIKHTHQREGRGVTAPALSKVRSRCCCALQAKLVKKGKPRSIAGSVDAGSLGCTS
jgi:VCBS repeat-containing protein